jgi:hypothetical protein
MMRQGKNRFIKQEHRSFIKWFIAVPAKITRSGHQTELKMFKLSRLSGKHHFYKADWEELDISTSSIQRRLMRWPKNKERR